MKRNKPLCKHRRSGTQTWRRRPYWSDPRRAETWTVIIPQAVAGDARTFDLSGAVPAGIENKPDDPTYAPNLYRWLLHIDGKPVMVFACWGGWYRWSTNTDRFRDAPSGDTWYAFTAEGKCGRSRCPLTRYVYSDFDAEVPRHRPGRCPLGMPIDGSWKYVGRVSL